MSEGTFFNGAPDICLEGANVLNVYSGELLEWNVTIRGERFQYAGPETFPAGEKTKVLDVTGKVLVPGYIEPHTHPWLIYNPVTLAREACRLGTTTFVCDNLIFFLLMGVDRFESFMDELIHFPVKFFWFCRSNPQTPMQGEEDLFSAENIKRLLRHPAAASLGEITRWQDLLAGDTHILEVIQEAADLKKRVDGHTAGAKHEKIAALSGLGVESCHESISAREVLDRLRAGFHVMLRESSLRQDLRELLKPLVQGGVRADRMMLTTDASSPAFHREFGITDNLLRIAMDEGVDPVTAYRMVSINPAVYFGMDRLIGGIAPGRYADILVLDDLRNPVPELVISKGRMVAEEGELCEPWPEISWEYFLPESKFIDQKWQAEKGHFRIPSNERIVRFPTIRLIRAVITKTEWIEFPVEDGHVDIGDSEDFCLISLISRDGTWVANGILGGMGGGVQGLASSFNTATQILAIGRDPEAMADAVNRVLELKGGIVAIEEGRIAYEFPLPLGGMMSNMPMTELAKKENELKEFLSERGHPFHDPLYTLVFLPNDFLPEVRINYLGVFNILEKKTLWRRRDLVPAAQREKHVERAD